MEERAGTDRARQIAWRKHSGAVGRRAGGGEWRGVERAAGVGDGIVCGNAHDGAGRERGGDGHWSCSGDDSTLAGEHDVLCWSVWCDDITEQRRRTRRRGLEKSDRAPLILDAVADVLGLVWVSVSAGDCICRSQKRDGAAYLWQREVGVE